MTKVLLQLSGERVLTMEWIEGCKLTDVDGLIAMHIHPRDVAIELLHAFAQMAFVDGFGRDFFPWSHLMCSHEIRLDAWRGHS